MSWVSTWMSTTGISLHLSGCHQKSQGAKNITTPPMAVVSSAVTTTMTYDGFHSYGASRSFGSAGYDSATTTDPKGHNKRSCWPCHCTIPTTSVQDAFSGLCHAFYSCKFLWTVEPPTDFLMLVSVTVSAFSFQVSNVAIMFNNRSSTIGVSTDD